MQAYSGEDEVRKEEDQGKEEEREAETHRLRNPTCLVVLFPGADQPLRGETPHPAHIFITVPLPNPSLLVPTPLYLLANSTLLNDLLPPR